MKWLVDTNILSESVRPRPSRQVLEWIARKPPDELALSIVTLAELRSGVSLTGDRGLRQELTRWIDEDVVPSFDNRVLPVTIDILIDWLHLVRHLAAKRKAAAPADLLLAATARIHDLAIVTRNIRDFAHTGLVLYNPWTDETHTMEGP